MGWRDWLKRQPKAGSGSHAPGDFREQLGQAGLAGWADQLIALDRPSIRLSAESTDPSDGMAVAISHLGGEPDLPPTVDWPEWNGKPLSFIAQIALSEMPELPEARLPPSGLLSFFYEAGQEAWGFDPADRGAWRVLWSPEQGLEPRSTPAAVPEDGRYQACRLTGIVEINHVPWESPAVDTLGMTREEVFAYADAFEADDAPIHRLLGHPEPIQGDMQLEAQLVSNGLYCGDPSDFEDPRAVELRDGAVDWRLLLQVDSDDGAGMMWGDAGRLYFWMTEDAIERRDWDSAWMILQCG